MPTRVVMYPPVLERYAPQIKEQVEEPITLAIPPSTRDENVCPLLTEAEIAITQYWTKAMGQSARRLRFIQMPGAGWDKIDAAGIPDGVLVANCYEHEWAIAEYVLMMCLAHARKLFEANQTIRQGNWRLFSGAGAPLPGELGARTIGLIGLGRIGRAVAQLASAFRMRRIGIDVLPLSDDQRKVLGLNWVGQPNDLDQLLRESDFIVLAVPLNDDTRSMIGPRELGLLEPSAFLINPARAELVDEQAIYQALRHRAFAGAALDPWWHYPKTDECVAPSRYPFAELDNVIMTPHISGSTIETFERRMQAVATNLNRFLRGEPVLNVVKELSRVTVATP